MYQLVSLLKVWLIIRSCLKYPQFIYRHLLLFFSFFLNFFSLMPPWLQSPVIASFSYNSNSSFSSVPMFHLLCRAFLFVTFLFENMNWLTPVWKYLLSGMTRLITSIKWWPYANRNHVELRSRFMGGSWLLIPFLLCSFDGGSNVSEYTFCFHTGIVLICVVLIGMIYVVISWLRNPCRWGVLSWRDQLLLFLSWQEVLAMFTLGLWLQLTGYMKYLAARFLDSVRV